MCFGLMVGMIQVTYHVFRAVPEKRTGFAVGTKGWEDERLLPTREKKNGTTFLGRRQSSVVPQDPPILESCIAQYKLS